jgi:hypothetical protein
MLMPRRMSLHVGLNQVDPAHYDGWDGQLAACEFDANDMRAIAESLGYDQSTTLLTAEATAERILSEIERAAGALSGGDLFFVSYSGHGGQVPDRNHDSDETDEMDETWVAFDRQIVDDELYARWAQFAEGVHIVLLSDSCHSGSVAKAIDQDVPSEVVDRETAAKQSPRRRAMPWDVTVTTYREHRDLYDGIQEQVPSAGAVEVPASVLLISGCQDEQLSSDGMANGLFTEKLLNVWDKGDWDGGGYAEFHAAILALMPPDQQSVYFKTGASNPEFEAQKPFTG